MNVLNRKDILLKLEIYMVIDEQKGRLLIILMMCKKMLKEKDGDI